VESVDHRPGKKLFAFLRAASDYHEHNAILIRGDRVDCLVRQIVGPVARRIFCWKSPGSLVERGERIGIMKFGSRLDVYLPRDGVEVVVREGDRVRAGTTVIARLKMENR
jgi:phosphatidylserine decarboxylase